MWASRNVGFSKRTLFSSPLYDIKKSDGFSERSAEDDSLQIINVDEMISHLELNDFSSDEEGGDTVQENKSSGSDDDSD